MSIVVNNKRFVEFLSKQELDNIITNLAAEVERDLGEKDPLYLVMLNGAFVFASDFLRKLTKPVETVFLRYSSYEGINTTGNVHVNVIPQVVKDRNVVVLEDIIDTGLTMDVFLKNIKNLHPQSVSIVSLFSKPTARKINVPLDYVGIEIENSFVVGFGLDYDGYGRNLDALYVLEE